jgi:predicted enzyme related to lactoylglutathione lyase
MGERTAYAPGTFCWTDLGARDPEGAQRFYGELLGWTAEITPGGYWMWTLDGKNVTGLFAAPEDFTPAWLSYISMPDVDATVDRARALGAAVPVEPRDIGPPGVDVGRSAILADPHGAAFGVWQPGLHIGAQLVNATGAMVWNQLLTPDPEAAKAFYAELFQWTYEPLEGSETPYSNIRNREGWLNGGVMALPAPEVPPHWLVSFTVEEAGVAAERVEALGGAVVQPPTPVGEVAEFRDPEGAGFAVFAGEPEP